MSQDKLTLSDCGDRYYICWICDDEVGSFLGDCSTRFNIAADLPGSNEHIIATEAARSTFEPGVDDAGLFWESRAAAQKALAAAKAALRAHRSAKPWPEWAKLAVAAGWKVPKGWQP